MKDYILETCVDSVESAMAAAEVNHRQDNKCHRLLPLLQGAFPPQRFPLHHLSHKFFLVLPLIPPNIASFLSE